MSEHGLQCGFCTPGMMMTARHLLDHNPDPDESHHPAGDLRARSADAPATRTSSARSAPPPVTRPSRPAVPRADPATDGAQHRRRRTQPGGTGMTDHPARAGLKSRGSAPPATRSASAGCPARRTPDSCAVRATTSTT